MKTGKNMPIKYRRSQGSVLILVVALTSLLAVLGVMFVMVTRVERISTSAISENKELNFAVETVVARISQVLVSDIPNQPAQEYYDYPKHTVNYGARPLEDQTFDPGPDGILNTKDDGLPYYGIDDDPWLASLEPVMLDIAVAPDIIDPCKPGFAHISDIYGTLAFLFQHSYDPGTGQLVDADSDNGDRISFRNLRARIIGPTAPFIKEGDKADADGDGVADSRWVKIPNMTSKGRDVYTAVRIIDNGGMLNANTAFLFDPNDPIRERVDGSSQTQINLAALSQRTGSNGPPRMAAYILHDRRCGIDEPNNILAGYDPNVIWQYESPAGYYTPFDICDELELRNRFTLNHEDILARIEENFWTWSFDSSTELETPVDTGKKFNKWFYRTQYEVPDPCYSYRHLLTTYNTDRIINPIRPRLSLNININNGKMFNLNDAEDADSHLDLYKALAASIDPNIDPTMAVIGDANQVLRRFAQLAVNVADFIDANDYQLPPLMPNPRIRAFAPGIGGGPNDVYFGFEAQPFITEVAWRIDVKPETGRNYFAVELYNPSNERIYLADFELELVDDSNSLNSVRIGFEATDVIRPDGCFVITNNLEAFVIAPLSGVRERPNLALFGGWIPPDKSKPIEDTTRDPDKSKPPVYLGWSEVRELYLRRIVGFSDPNGSGPAIGAIYVDRQTVEDSYVPPAGDVQYLARDTRDWHVVYQTIQPTSNSLGVKNTVNINSHNFSFYLPNPYQFLLDPVKPLDEFVTVGDIARILTIGNSFNRYRTIGQQLSQWPRNAEYNVRFDLQDPYSRNIFQYVTVFDPSADNIDNDADNITDEDVVSLLNETPELKVPGRININTAPWYVLAQLPWVSQRRFETLYYNNPARAIVAYRDKLPLFDSIGNMITDYTSRTVAIASTKPLREEAGFASIGELNFVIGGTNSYYSMQKYSLDNTDLLGLPDLTEAEGPGLGDGIPDDFEERDMIFSRISNLVTVRSDVFTAYILVRLGFDGPQKRFVAILDRSNAYSSDSKVKVVALHQVPDPR